MQRLFLIWLFLLTAPVLRGQEPFAFVVPPAVLEADSVSLYDFAGYFCDSTNRLEFDEVRVLTDRFVPLESAARKFDNRYLHWVYFRIDNRGSLDTLRRYLFSYFPNRSYWFQADSRGITKRDFGTVSHNIRDFEGCSYLLPVTFPSGEEIQCFVQLDDRLSLPKRKQSSYGLNILSVEKGRDWIQWAMEDRYQIRLMLAMFLGILLFMVLFTSLMYLQNRERTYLHYALYVGSIFLLYAVRRSYEFQTPFSYITNWWHYVYPTIALLVFLAYVNFIRSFLDVTPERYPGLARTLKAAMGLICILLALDFILKLLLPLHVYFTLFERIRPLLFISGGWIIYRVYQLHNPLSKYIIGGTFALIAGVLVVLITDLIRERTGLDLQSRPFSYAQMGVAAEILIFALGLGYRARLLREEKMKAELRALKAQMNPHFVFNSLNAINHLIRKSKSEDAANYLTKFARLFRGILDHSEREKITLKEELEFCRDYLSIEALRFDDSFRFEIESDPALADFLVAPLTFQPFLENAIRHGLLPRQGERWVKLQVSVRGDRIVGRVEDNGVGRSAAGVGSSGFGIRLAKERLERQFPGARVHISDKFDKFGQSEGTVVEVTFFRGDFF